METKWLEDFVSLAETRSFSRSAQLRHMTQPAFSRRIQALDIVVALQRRIACPRRRLAWRLHTALPIANPCLRGFGCAKASAHP